MAEVLKESGRAMAQDPCGRTIPAVEVSQCRFAPVSFAGQPMLGGHLGSLMVDWIMMLRVSMLFGGLCCLVIPGEQASAAVTAAQRAKLDELSEAIREAGKLYTDGKFVDCAEKVTQVQKGLVGLLESKDPALQRLAKPIYARLGRAHGLLELEGAELEALPGWTELTRGGKGQGDPTTSQVSFKDDIAPWFISACGNCHINNRRGQFSLATYADLRRGAGGNAVLFAGSARGSRIVEVIESGDMPRGGGKVSDAQLTSLKQWIDQGAKFDGPNPNASLTTFAKRATPVAGAPTNMSANSPTGKETVSFARDVAPILMENCNGCHIAGQRASGNLRMDTFAQLLRGGGSGSPINGGNPDESLLIRKLKGEAGARMPAGGRPPLSDEQISLISTWIREGASFDGPSPSTNIDVVIQQAWASEAGHEELFERRRQRALAKWSRVLPNDQPETAASDEVFVLGNVSSDRVQATLKQVEGALAQAKRLLRTPAKEPLLRGGLAIFVLKSRYDYSEFGRMTENRELPKTWLGHWKADTVDAYAVLASDSEIEDKQASAVALQVVAGAYLGSFREVPIWFAEGVARNLVVTSFRRSDQRVVDWQRALPLALQKVDSAKTLLDNRLDEEVAGLVGMALANSMMDRANRRRFDKLVELLREGRTFTEATTFAFGPPEVLVKGWLGK